MTQTNAGTVGQRKQIPPPDSLCEEARRLEDLQNALIEVGKAGDFPLSYLQRPQSWYNANRNPEEYEPTRPYLTEQEMIRDKVATAARIGTPEQRDAVRAAVVRYFQIRAEDALEMIGTEAEANLTTLTLHTEREISEARCATIQALTIQTAESLDKAVKENREADTLMDQLTESLRMTARRLRNGARLSVAR